MNQDDPAAQRATILRKLRAVLGLFVLGLVLSGVTAFPLHCELKLMAAARGLDRKGHADSANSFDRWILTVRDGLGESYTRHPWLAYGTDWLAFAHIVIAVFFIGPLVDPLRNVWVLRAGLIACALVVPLALVCGAVRQTPFGWRLLDCSFGVFGSVPLYYCLRLTRALENKQVPFESCRQEQTKRPDLQVLRKLLEALEHPERVRLVGEPWWRRSWRRWTGR